MSSDKVVRAINRKQGDRDPHDGKPYYCKLCGLGWNEYMACEEVDCKLETVEDAGKRYEASAEIPAIVGYNVGDYSQIMEE